MKDSSKEKTKLLATLLNTLAAAMITIGFTTPLAGSLYMIPNSPPISTVAAYGAGWCFLGIGLHLVACWVLKDLD